MFNQEDYELLHALVFSPDYPGYKPAVREAPNGDGKVDTGKRYAHVNETYLADVKDRAVAFVLGHYLTRAYREALRVAELLNVPEAYLPGPKHGTLRVLEYPAGTGSEMHTDACLFTLNLYRSAWNEGLGSEPVHIGEIGEIVDLGKAFPHSVLPCQGEQFSIVYFAIPSHEALLPGCHENYSPGPSVGSWLSERIARSRQLDAGLDNG